MNSLTWILIISGVFSAILGVLGFVGAKNKSRVLLSIYLILLFLLFVFKLIGIFFGVSFQNRLKSELNGVLADTISESLGKNNHSDYTIHKLAVTTIDQIQTTFACCGSVSSIDYIRLNATLPTSCFSNGVAYASGCADSIYNTFTSHLPIVMGALVIIMLIELCAVMFSICVCAKHKKEAYDQF